MVAVPGLRERMFLMSVVGVGVEVALAVLVALVHGTLEAMAAILLSKALLKAIAQADVELKEGT